MTELPKYVTIQISKSSFIVARLPIGRQIYEKLAATETEAAAQQLASVLGAAKRQALRTQKQQKQRKPVQQRGMPKPRMERLIRMPRPRPDPLLTEEKT